MGREGMLDVSSIFRSMRSRSTTSKLLLVVAACSFAFTLPSKKRVDKKRQATTVGSAFPTFSTTTFQGSTWNNSVFTGKVTLVSAWRIGCSWCMMEIPEYNNMLDTIHDPRFQMISFAPQTMDEISNFYGEDTAFAPAAIRVGMGVPVPAYDVAPMCTKKREKDPHVLTVQCDALEELLGADGFPVAFIVGPDGVIRHRHDGMLADPETMRPKLDLFMNELDSLLRSL